MLDTNAVSWFVRNPSLPLEARLAAMVGTAFCISVVTEGELRYGLARRPRAQTLARIVESLLARLQVVPWDRLAARQYGSLRAALEAAGTPLAPIDTLIAAHALAENAVLVTSDRAFNRVPDLIVEDWSAGAG